MLQRALLDARQGFRYLTNFHYLRPQDWCGIWSNKVSVKCYILDNANQSLSQPSYSKPPLSHKAADCA